MFLVPYLRFIYLIGFLLCIGSLFVRERSYKHFHMFCCRGKTPDLPFPGGLLFLGYLLRNLFSCSDSDSFCGGRLFFFTFRFWRRGCVLSVVRDKPWDVIGCVSSEVFVLFVSSESESKSKWQNIKTTNLNKNLYVQVIKISNRLYSTWP